MVILQESSVTSSMRIKSNENRLEIWRLGPRWNALQKVFSALSPEFLSRACILCLNFRGVLYSFATVVVSE